MDAAFAHQDPHNFFFIGSLAGGFTSASFWNLVAWHTPGTVLEHLKARVRLPHLLG